MVNFVLDNQGTANPAEIPISNDCREPGPGRGLYTVKLGRVFDINDIGRWILRMNYPVVGNYVTYDGDFREDWDVVPYPTLDSIRDNAVKLADITTLGALHIMRNNDEAIQANDGYWVVVEEFVQYF